MARAVLFSDESGNFDFRRATGATKYFVLATVTFEEHTTVEAELLELRRGLAWGGEDLAGGFHCTYDNYAVRSQVFSVLMKHNFRIDATIYEKSKVVPTARASDVYFYKLAWFYHLKHIMGDLVRGHKELQVVAASLGTRNRRSTLHRAVADVVRQTAKGVLHQTACWSCDSDPCLQVADYCCWAINRKWEFGDDAWYHLIFPKVETEFDFFRRASKHYY